MLSVVLVSRDDFELVQNKGKNIMYEKFLLYNNSNFQYVSVIFIFKR